MGRSIAERRAKLIEWIQDSYYPTDDMERTHRLHMLHALRTVPDFLYRSCNEPGHLTASGWIVTYDLTHVLLQMHKYRGKWMPSGGHVDGDIDHVRVARKEVQEEVGRLNVRVLMALFDIDTHQVPANPKKDEPEHLHFDLRVLFTANRRNPLPVSPEGIVSQWFSLDEAEAHFPQGGGRRRCLDKIRTMAEKRRMAR